MNIFMIIENRINRFLASYSKARINTKITSYGIRTYCTPKTIAVYCIIPRLVKTVLNYGAYFGLTVTVTNYRSLR